MKRLLATLLCIVLLTGCSLGQSEIDRAIGIRQRLLSGKGCCFDAVITADYGEEVHTFSMNCRADANGGVHFTVTAPETISGITGRIDHEGGKLTFDDAVLAFELLADGQVTPISAPWLFICTLRSGYLSACGEDANGLRIQIDDSYANDALMLDIWTDADELPYRCEILWQGRRILSLDVRNFEYL